jgi:general secretion pathway protein G
MKDTRNARKTADAAGFTLIELMIVIAIIAVLASLVGASLLNAKDSADVAAAKAQISLFKTSLMQYRLKFNRFPDDMQSLITNEKNYPCIDAKEIPKDPWGNPYIYTCENGRSYKIVSYGADGKAGGSGPEADIESDSLNASE